MKNIFLLLALVSLICFSCKSRCCLKNESAKVDTTVVITEANEIIPVKDTAVLYPFVVTFFSIGQGTDRTIHPEFKEFYSTYVASNMITVDQARWGREGEVDYCINFVKMDKAQQKEFLTKAKTILARSQLVNVKENVACPHKRN